MLHGAEIRNLSSSAEKYHTSERSERVRYFSAREDKFRIAKRPCYLLFIIWQSVVEISMKEKRKTMPSKQAYVFGWFRKCKRFQKAVCAGKYWLVIGRTGKLLACDWSNAKNAGLWLVKNNIFTCEDIEDITTGHWGRCWYGFYHVAVSQYTTAWLSYYK